MDNMFTYIWWWECLLWTAVETNMSLCAMYTRSNSTAASTLWKWQLKMRKCKFLLSVKVRLLLGDWIASDTWSVWKILWISYTRHVTKLLSGRLPAAHQFPLSLKQDGSASLATWHVQIPGQIITKLWVRHSDHQEIGGDLVPLIDWVGFNVPLNTL